MKSVSISDETHGIIEELRSRLVGGNGPQDKITDEHILILALNTLAVVLMTRDVAEEELAKIQGAEE